MKSISQPGTMWSPRAFQGVTGKNSLNMEAQQETRGSAGSIGKPTTGRKIC